MHSSDASSFKRFDVTIYFTFFLVPAPELLELLYLLNSERGVFDKYDVSAFNFIYFDALEILWAELSTSLRLVGEVSYERILVSCFSLEFIFFRSIWVEL